MQLSKFFRPLAAALLALGLSTAAPADTIRLRDGSVIRGQVVGFKDQQFTVLIGSGARGRRSRITLFMEDVDSIEFEGDGGGAGGIGGVVGGGSPPDAGDATAADTAPPRADAGSAPANARTAPPANNSRTQDTARRQSPGPARNTGATGAPVFVPISLRVRGDNYANGWNDSGLMVRAGQRLRITASGRVSLGGGVFSTPAGLPARADRDKLMRNEPTGALIAVIGDDNDDFIFVGARGEFTARRDGRLFLGVNEGNLNDNSGYYEVTVEAEAPR